MNVELRGLPEQVLNLSAVLADDADVIASCLASPVLINVERAELAEAVCREENLVLAVVGHDDLGPVNHGSSDEGQGMFAELEGIALADDDSSVLKLGAEEVLHHVERLCR